MLKQYYRDKMTTILKTPTHENYSFYMNRVVIVLSFFSVVLVDILRVINYVISTLKVYEDF